RTGPDQLLLRPGCRIAFEHATPERVVTELQSPATNCRFDEATENIKYVMINPDGRGRPISIVRPRHRAVPGGIVTEILVLIQPARRGKCGRLGSVVVGDGEPIGRTVDLEGGRSLWLPRKERIERLVEELRRWCRKE